MIVQHYVLDGQKLIALRTAANALFFISFSEAQMSEFGSTYYCKYIFAHCSAHDKNEEYH